MLRILVRDSSTRLYRTLEGDWTEDEKQAQHFISASVAVLFCEEEECGAYDIVIKTDDARCDMVVFHKTPIKS